MGRSAGENANTLARRGLLRGWVSEPRPHHSKTRPCPTSTRCFRSGKQGDILIILVDADDLERWIAADDRLAVLGELHERAVFDLKR